MIESIVCS